MLVFASCSGAKGSNAALPKSPPVIVVTMKDHRFEHPPAIPAGRVIFQVPNTGGAPHRLTLFPLPEDVPPIDVQLRGGERRRAARFAGVPTQPPGATGKFAVNLVAGRRYAMVCFVQEPDGTSHAQRGMVSEFRAGGPVQEPPPSSGGTPMTSPAGSSTSSSTVDPKEPDDP